MAEHRGPTPRQQQLGPTHAGRTTSGEEDDGETEGHLCTLLLFGCLLRKLVKKIIPHLFSNRLDEARSDGGNHAADLNFGIAANFGLVAFISKMDMTAALNKTRAAFAFQEQFIRFGHMLFLELHLADITAF